MAQGEFSLYILRCSDNSLYTGIAADVEKRIAEHRSGTRGAKYLRGRQPLKLEYSKPVGDRAAALRVEYRVKRLPRSQKERLIRGQAALAELVDIHGDDAASGSGAMMG